MRTQAKLNQLPDGDTINLGRWKLMQSALAPDRYYLFDVHPGQVLERTVTYRQLQRLYEPDDGSYPLELE